MYQKSGEQYFELITTLGVITQPLSVTDLKVMLSIYFYYLPLFTIFLKRKTKHPVQ